MPINFSTDVYLPCQDVFSVPCTFHFVYSAPDGASFEGRGIYDTDEVDVMAEDGSVFADQRTILDIRKAEFPIMPKQHDRVTIPFNSSGEPLGEFEITEVSDNGGGELTLVLRAWKPEPLGGRFYEPGGGQ